MLDGELYRILELQHVTPGNLRGFVRVKLRNLRNGTLQDQRLRSEDVIERASLDEIADAVHVQRLRRAPLHGHDAATSRSRCRTRCSATWSGYLVPESVIKVEFYGTEPVGIELPQTVDLTVTDTAPAIKGATASAQLKPATLETGLVVSGAAVHQRRRQGAREHGVGRVPGRA